MTADVTVVIPTHNRRALLEQTLRCVLGQVEIDVEVVVVDEASCDGTTALLDGLNDARVSVVRHASPQGLPSARNAGLDRAVSPWIAFCDDDDLWAPDKLAAQLTAACAQPRAQWVACGSVLVDPELRILDHQRPGVPGDARGRLMRGNDIPGGGSGVMARTDLVRSVGAFRVGEHCGEDWDLWVRLAQSSPLAVVDRPLVAYRIWEGSMSRESGPMIAAFDRITRRYAATAAELGVQPDAASQREYLAKQRLRNRDRRGATKLYLDVARMRGAPGDWARVAAAALAPSWTNRVGDRRALSRVPRPWTDEVRAWLSAVEPDASHSVWGGAHGS